jgi:hypothetical protein
MIRNSFLVVVFLFAGTVFNSTGQTEEIVWNCCHPEKGVLPDDNTAISVAKAILLPIYHHGILDREEPFAASLDGGAWTVTGTAPKFIPQRVEKTTEGTRVTVFSEEGPLQVLLSKKDGRVLRCCTAQGKNSK